MAYLLKSMEEELLEDGMLHPRTAAQSLLRELKRHGWKPAKEYFTKAYLILLGVVVVFGILQCFGNKSWRSGMLITCILGYVN